MVVSPIERPIFDAVFKIKLAVLACFVTSYPASLQSTAMMVNRVLRSVVSKGLSASTSVVENRAPLSIAVGESIQLIFQPIDFAHSIN